MAKTAARSNRWKKFAIWASVIIVALVAGLFAYLASVTYSPSKQAEDAMKSDGKVLVSEIRHGYQFEPKDQDIIQPNVVFYPGGLVEPASYAPMARKLAEQGHRVYIARMPLNLAMFGGSRADSFLAQHPDETYVIGGHSLGGVFASRYAAAHTDQIKGVFYLASYADEGGRLNSSSLSALQITGSKDGVLNWEEWEKAKNNLPQDTTFVSIEGGNHGQFGSYGMQKGDNTPQITEEKQLQQVIQALEVWFEKWNK
ncbi:alpha/beta hydrolase [Paenibacillus silvae]|uniref:alpha/beta hydrolase n=1 Tax=Paenibacillus silvae TaxID=1325358 RepID=UPI002003564A|nr:alpha/beta hydrolase [Paenibacillus silvae]MCK6073369.1 alpha/beta hydrolase [Paenibacillus silvae]MCK6149155.1 alpha/beta hydrolase [Paenibacillus silvae]MCK6267454.1 alpha/beta hydrolase [Paenibacillus silvae]